MEDVLKIASYIVRRYEHEYGASIDEVKLHILLYFMQRESLTQTGKTLFEDTFCAKSFGPFLLKVHDAYAEGRLAMMQQESSRYRYKSTIDKVYVALAAKKVRSLCSLAHGEYSWKNAFEKGEGTAICVEDIKYDANRFRMRCFLLSNLDQFRKPSYV